MHIFVPIFTAQGKRLWDVTGLQVVPCQATSNPCLHKADSLFFVCLFLEFFVCFGLEFFGGLVVLGLFLVFLCLFGSFL